ncbi:hypothetical protein BS78_01G152200 [Paspalum vaginatum]|nr:hypothetical protein BS78_01G152200 [Paspalum vaginatum]
MAGQLVMEGHQARLQPPATPFAALPPNCKDDIHHLTTTTTSSAMSTPAAGSNATAAADMAAYLQQLRDAAAASDPASRNGGARGEQCPRCASHDTKFCYYNNYNTSQPRHFCRACRRYWTLGGSLRNVPIGGSTRKRPRLAHHHHHQQSPAARRAPHVFGLGLGSGGGAPPMPLLPPSTQGQGGGSLLSSLFALGAGAPLLEGRGAAGFDLGLGLPAGPCLLGAGEPGIGMQMQGLGLRGGGGSSAPGSAAAGASSSFMWPAGLLDSDGVDTWKMPSAGAGSTMWPEFSVAAPPQISGLLHGSTHLM